VEDYNLYIRHETLRVAVILTLKNMKQFNLLFSKEMKEYFLNNYDSYVKSCDDCAQQKISGSISVS